MSVVMLFQCRSKSRSNERRSNLMNVFMTAMARKKVTEDRINVFAGLLLIMLIFSSDPDGRYLRQFVT